MSTKPFFSRVEQDRIAHFTIHHLQPIADYLDALVGALMDQWSIPYRQDNGADNMVLTFVTKQREHLRSVRILLDAEAHRDALLIARTMLEGSGKLRWAFSDTPARTELWFWFAAIRDYRQILKNQEEGMQVDPEEVAQLKALVDTHGHNYYTPKVQTQIAKAVKRGQTYELPADPWGFEWTDTTIKDMFDELKDEKTYKFGYQNPSEWVHWDPRTIFRSVSFVPSGVSGFTEKDWSAGGRAFQIACTSLLECLQVLDTHFSLNLRGRLQSLDAWMLAVLNQAISEGFPITRS